ncbi:MAG: phage tail protein [Bacteroidota bacterium]
MMKPKKKILTIGIVIITTLSYAQNVGINSTGATPNASAVLDVDAAPGNDKGLLMPRVALVATNNAAPVTAPAVSLMVYNTATAGVFPNNVIPGFYYWDGTQWIVFGKPSAPAGEVIAFAGATAPAGYLLSDGTAVSRTTYAGLFAVIGVMYGPGDGSTTFNLPNYQGYFLRGKNNASGNDPDFATRTDRGDGITGDNVGTKQTSIYGSHRHAPDLGGTPNSAFGVFFNYGSFAYPVAGGNYGTWANTTITAYTDYQGGNETRPKNINVLYCIKY